MDPSNGEQPGKRVPQSHAKPYQSPLWEYLETIRRLRRKRQTWAAIALHLKESHGLATTSATVFKFFKRDDPTAKESAAKTIRFFGDATDYLLVENPAKFKSDEFKKTALHAWLAERSTPTLRIPSITALTMNAWETSERKLKRYLPLEEACQEEGLHELSRYECTENRNTEP